MIGTVALVWSSCTIFGGETDGPLHEGDCVRPDKLAEVVEAGVTNSYFYDLEGRVISITSSSGWNVRFIYDPENHPQTVTRIITQPTADPFSPFIVTNVFFLGRHDLADTDSAGTTYEYDEHQFLVLITSPSFTETRTIVEGNITQIVLTEAHPITNYYTYTSIENCADTGVTFLGKSSRDWPASVLAVGPTGDPLSIVYTYGFDVLGRVIARTATINEHGNSKIEVTYYRYE